MPSNIKVLQICRFTIAFVWLYQGLVPKLLGPHPDELAMNMTLGMNEASATLVAYAGGSLEILLGILVVIFYKKTWVFLLTAIAMLGLFVFTIMYAPLFVIAAFNSTTINLSIVALSAIALVCLDEAKTGRQS
jgi:uncharacterized membrane protein YphA (DoxX/SURF4 family)